MSSKTYLVARREFLENLRTSTFWVGIISFPVILVLSIVVPMWLKKAKDVRKYAVLDQSGWLLPVIDERADLPDMEAVFLELARRAKKEATAAGLPDPVREAARALAAISDVELKKVAALMAAAARPDAAREAGGQMLPEEARAALLKSYEPIRIWWKALPPEEAARYAPDATKTRYRRVELAALGATGPDAEAVLNKKIDAGDLFAYFVIGPDPIAGSEGSKYVSKNLTDLDLKRWFTTLATAEVLTRRFEREKIDERIAVRIQRPLDFSAQRLSEAGVTEKVQTKDTVRQWAPIVFVYLLWMSVFIIAQMLLTNTVEEKASRIIEVLLSSVSPFQLMSGKIAGLAATGLTVIGSWLFFFIAAVKLVPVFTGQAIPFDLTPILRDKVYVTSFVVYFLLGYLLYAAVLVAIGSVCNSLKEAQNLMMPVVLMLMVPLFAMIPIGEDPNGALAKVLSYVPLFTPFVMMNRAAGPPAAIEYAITGVLLVLAIIFAFWAAAKVFRIGVLMTGKPPHVGEILRWIRAPVGLVPGRKTDGGA